MIKTFIYCLLLANILTSCDNQTADLEHGPLEEACISANYEMDRNQFPEYIYYSEGSLTLKDDCTYSFSVFSTESESVEFSGSYRRREYLFQFDFDVIESFWGVLTESTLSVHFVLIDRVGASFNRFDKLTRSHFLFVQNSATPTPLKETNRYVNEVKSYTLSQVGGAPLPAGINGYSGGVNFVLRGRLDVWTQSYTITLTIGSKALRNGAIVGDFFDIRTNTTSGTLYTLGDMLHFNPHLYDEENNESGSFFGLITADSIFVQYQDFYPNRTLFEGLSGPDLLTFRDN